MPTEIVEPLTDGGNTVDSELWCKETEQSQSRAIFPGSWACAMSDGENRTRARTSTPSRIRCRRWEFGTARLRPISQRIYHASEAVGHVWLPVSAANATLSGRRTAEAQCWPAGDHSIT
jgi:hypothetical protein